MASLKVGAFAHGIMAYAIVATLGSDVLAANKPNIVVILADDLGWTETSVQIDSSQPFSKSDYHQTPRLEALAAAGMRFSHAYAAPMCSATRQAIQTGKSPARLQHTDVIAASMPTAGRYLPLYTGQPASAPLINGSLAASEVTIAEWLDQNSTGYVTAHYGKWHVAYSENGRNATAPKYGYDFENMPPTTLIPPAEDGKETFRTTEAAMNFMSARAANSQPFYMQLSYSAPHDPYAARPSTLAKWQNVPVGQRHSDPLYAAMLEDMDTGIGMVLDKIQQLGLGDDTYVIFASDNGSIARSSTVNTPLFQYKGSVYEGGVRVPMIVTGPGVSAGTQSNVPVTLQDLFATVSATAGITAPLANDLESANLLPLFHNGGGLPDGVNALSRAYAPNGELFYHFPHYAGTTPNGPRVPASAIRDGDYKLVRVYGEKGNPDTILLFNLAQSITESADPLSTLNLANSMPEKTALMLGKLNQWLENVDASLPYDMAANADLVWKASNAGVNPETWRSVNDVKGYFREQWLRPNGTSQPTNVATAAFQPGLGKRAFHFDGNDVMTREFFRVSDTRPPSGSDSNRSTSIETWFRTDAMTGNQVLFESGDGSAGISLTLGDSDGNGKSNDLRFRVLGSSGASLTATVPIDAFTNPTANAVQAFAVFNDDNANRYIELYVNGALAARIDGTAGAAGSMQWDAHNTAWLDFQQAGIGNIAGTGTGGGLGGNGGGGALPFSGAFRGDIAGVGFFNYAISAATIASKYNAQLHPASFGLKGATGAAAIASTRPVNVSLGLAESNSLQAVLERQHQLAQSLGVSAVVNSSVTFNSGSAPSGGTLTAGTGFDSYLMHFDPIGSNGALNNTATGSIVFARDIIAIVLDVTTLAATDGSLGAIGNYGAIGDRGVQLAGSDFISISTNRRTLTFSLTISGDEMAQFRVLTQPAVPGDFDGDGLVNAADLAVWKVSVGENAFGDADGDGDTDGNDFLTWQRQYGATSIQSAALSIPEPSAACLLITVAVGLCLRRRQLGRELAA